MPTHTDQDAGKQCFRLSSCGFHPHQTITICYTPSPTRENARGLRHWSGRSLWGCGSGAEACVSLCHPPSGPRATPKPPFPCAVQDGTASMAGTGLTGCTTSLCVAVEIQADRPVVLSTCLGFGGWCFCGLPVESLVSRILTPGYRGGGGGSCNLEFLQFKVRTKFLYAICSVFLRICAGMC